MVAVITRKDDGTTELYDMDRDPGQITNLANVAELSNVVKELTERLDERLSVVKDLSNRKK